jgi:hypothetical protein
VSVSQVSYVNQTLISSDGSIDIVLDNVGNTDLTVSGTGNNSPINPTFSYTDGQLTSVVYSGGQTKTLTYSGGVLTQLDFYNLINTIRKTFNYTGGVLTSITQTVL